jgi:hypothetical protein
MNDSQLLVVDLTSRAMMSDSRITIVQFLNRVVPVFLAPILLLGPLFIALKAQRYEIVSRLQADQMIRWAKSVWPVLASQYSRIQTVDPIAARLYALLSTISLIVLVILFVYSIVRFYAIRGRIRMPGTPEYLTAVLAPVLYLVFAFMDSPRERYTAGFFWVDDFGLYFFRQYVVVIGVAAAVLVGCLTILKIGDKIVSHVNNNHIK